MTNSILNSTKKAVGVHEDYKAFDIDILMYINGVFSTLNQLGIGPVEGFAIEDETTEWDAYLGGDLRLNSVKSLMTVSVRLLFDPPTTSYLLTAMKEQKQELEWRLNAYRENGLGNVYVPVLDGGSATEV